VSNNHTIRIQIDVGVMMAALMLAAGVIAVIAWDISRVTCPAEESNTTGSSHEHR